MGLLDNTEKKAKVVNAREIIIFSKPKIGKTVLYTLLPEPYLILDFEQGTDFYDASAINIDSLETFNKLRDEFLEKKPHYKFIVLDTFTSLYNNLINQIAVMVYNTEEKKKKSLDFDIEKLDYGKGHVFKREALKKVKDFFRNYCDHLILSAHSAEKSYGEDNLTVEDLDVAGKLKNILALQTDAIGLLNRTAPDQNTLSFTTQASNTLGTRVKHLAGKEFIISEKKEDGEIVAYWDKIFI